MAIGTEREREREITITGIDGIWVPHQYLVIPQINFFPTDISKNLKNETSELWTLPKYDIIISLEVAEHIEQNLSDNFVKFITSHSNYILFSAAIPGQTGDGHINEQWPSYWAEKFFYYGFELFDFIRHKIWDDDKIPFWYRQNCFLGARKGLLQLPDSQRVTGKKFDIVHPKQFEFIYNNKEQQSVMAILKTKILEKF